jgi:hypothetical protein
MTGRKTHGTDQLLETLARLVGLQVREIQIVIGIDRQTFATASRTQPTLGIKIHLARFVRTIQIAGDELDPEAGSGYQIQFSHTLNSIRTAYRFLILHDTKKAHRSELIKDKKEVVVLSSIIY